MAVNTGMVPDDDDVLADAGQTKATPPPAEIASVDVLAAEKAATEGTPTIPVRGQVFRLRSKIPGMLLLQLTRAQQDIQSPGGMEDPVKQSRVLATTFDTITKLVVGEDRDAFINWCEDAEPPLEMVEITSLLSEMMTEITGRPTSPASP